MSIYIPNVDSALYAFLSGVEKDFPRLPKLCRSPPLIDYPISLQWSKMRQMRQFSQVYVATLIIYPPLPSNCIRILQIPHPPPGIEQRALPPCLKQDLPQLR